MRHSTSTQSHTLSGTHSLTQALCSHAWWYTQDSTTRNSHVCAVQLSLSRAVLTGLARCLPFLPRRPRRHAVDGKTKGIPSLLFSQDFLRMYVFEYIFIVFLFFFVTESCGLLGILGRLIPTRLFCCMVSVYFPHLMPGLHVERDSVFAPQEVFLFLH